MKTKLLFCLLPLFSCFSQTLTLDPTFGVAGKTSTVFGTGQINLTSIAEQANGKIVACGNYYDGILNQIALARYNSDGSADMSFGVNGFLLTAVGTTFPADTFTVRIQSDGKIVVGGTVEVGSDDHFVLVRYNINGSLDTGFADNGILITDHIGRGDTIEIQSDGRILIAGYVNTTGADFAIARYNVDGSMDTTFGTNGLATLNIGTVSNPSALSDDEVTELAILPDGKILAAGKRYAAAEENMNFAIARFNSDGSLDMDFAVYGKMITDFGGNETPINLHMLSDGKFLISGTYTPDDSLQPTVAIAKYDANGFLDTTYGTDGLVLQNFAFAGQSGVTTSSVLDPGGKLIVTGVISSTNPNFTLLRFNSDGSLDDTLDGDGILSVDLGAAEAAQASLFQTNGKLIIGGDSFGLPGSDFTLARFNNDALSVDSFSEKIFSIYPNPFKDVLNMDCNLSQSGIITIDLLEITGRKIKSLVNKEFISGQNSLRLVMPDDLSNGAYLLHIYDDNFQKNIKIIKN